MSTRESYVTVHGVLKRKTDKAALIATDYGEGWIPRSCVHFATDQMIDDMNGDDEGEFEIMGWVAEDRGLI